MQHPLLTTSAGLENSKQQSSADVNGAVNRQDLSIHPGSNSMMQLHFAGPMAKHAHMASQGVMVSAASFATKGGTVSLLTKGKATMLTPNQPSNGFDGRRERRYRQLRSSCPPGSRNCSQNVPKYIQGRQLHPRDGPNNKLGHHPINLATPTTLSSGWNVRVVLR